MRSGARPTTLRGRPHNVPHNLPQRDGKLFLTDGGMETELIFHEGIDLPEFAAFDLANDEHETERLRNYYAPDVALTR
jgi:homocysteine S-methyltransferase